jgi:hypothetical protein
MQLSDDTIEQRDALARLAFERALAEDRLRVDAGNALIERELARTVREVRPTHVLCWCIGSCRVITG